MNTMMKYAALESRKRDSRGRFVRSEEDLRMGGIRSELDNRYDDSRMEDRTRYEGPRMEDRNRYEEDLRRMRYGGDWPIEPERARPLRGDGTFRMTYEDGAERRMIGFGNMEGRYTGPLKGDEFEHRSSPKERGYADSKVYPKFDEEMAAEWVRKMKNRDGTKSPHWTLKQAQDLMAEKGIKCDPTVFWACMNAEYSDRCEVYKKYGVDTPGFYADCVKAFWLEDADAVEDKPAAYYACVVKH